MNRSMNLLSIHCGLALAIMLALGCARSDRSAQGNEAAGDSSKSSRVVLQNKGSDTLVNVAQAWAEGYRDVNPSVAIAVTGGGSGTGISSLLNGTVDLANSSRAMKSKEVALAKSKGKWLSAWAGPALVQMFKHLTKLDL